MGFECCYHYHERIDGEYNKDETKTFKKKVGDALEDVPLEKLAAAIMAQLARRDVWITDVEVFEISKKPVSFKEAKGGIVIKNKKFLFDGGGTEATFVAVEDLEQPSTQHVPSSIQFQSSQQLAAPQHLSAAAHPHNINVAAPVRQKRPVDYVMYVPEPQQLHEAKRRNLRLTVNKKYPVMEKKMAPNGVGEIFVVLDDLGREQSVSDAYFVPGNINLIADRELGFSENQQDRDGGNLYWGSASSDPGMPDIRKR